LGYGLDDRGSITVRGNDVMFSLYHRIQTGCEVHPASYQMANGDPGLKWSELEAEHSLPPSAEVKNAWGYTSTPQYFIAWCLVKYRDNFTLPYLILPYLTLFNSSVHRHVVYLRGSDLSCNYWLSQGLRQRFSNFAWRRIPQPNLLFLISPSYS